MTASIKITALTDIGANIAPTSLVPVVNMAGTPVTQKANLQIVGNLILDGAGGSYFPAAAQAVLAQTVVTAAQPNITSVGTLNSLTVTGNMTTGNIIGGNLISAAFFSGDGGFLSNVGGAGGAGGSNTQIQFNDDGAFGGSANFTFNNTTGVFTSPFLAGNGNGLSNIQGANVSGFVANANVANTAFSVAAANVSGLGNIATTNYDGNASNVLHGDGTWSADTTTYGNSNVVTLLSAFGSNTITTTGNISGGNVLTSAQVIANGIIESGTGISTGGYLSVNGNTDLHDTTVTGNLSATGNITATNLGNISSINLDGNVSNLLTGNGTYVAIPVVPTVGNIATINLDGSNSNVLYGNGVFAAVTVGNLSQISNGNSNVTLTDTNGNVYINTNGGTQKQWIFDTVGNLRTPGNVDIYGAINFPQQVSSLNWSTYNIELSQYGRINTNVDFFANANTIGALYLKGDGSNISNIAGANVSGTVGNANLSQYLAVSDVNNNFSYHVVLSAGSGDESLHIDADDNLQYNPADGTLTSTRVDATYVLANLNYANGYLASNLVGSMSNIANGNSNIDIAIADGNIVINSAGNSWNFDTTGNLSLPEGGSIYSEGFTPSGNPGNTITLNPHGSGSITNQKLLVYPTAGDGDHIHLTSGNLYQTELFLGSDNLFVKLANTGNIIINSDDDAGNTAQWKFGIDGNLTASGNLIIAGNTNVFGTDSALIQPTDDKPLIALSSGANGAVSSVWVEDIGNVGTSNIAAVYANPTVGSGIVRIAVGQNGGNTGPNLWDFGATGNLTLPGNTVAINFANGSSAFGNIVATNLDGNVSNLLTGNGTYVAIPTVPTVGNIATLNLDGNSQTWLAGNGVFANITIPSVGNIATLNLDGNASNVLRGDGTFGADANSSYGDSNVVSLLSAFGSNTIVTTGIITADGANLSNVPYANLTGSPSLGNISNINLDGNVSNLLTGNGTYVAIPVVPTVGNIATINLDGNVSNVLNGNGVFAAVPAPTVSQDITSNGAMSIMTYDGNLKYVSYATVEPSTGNIAGGNISATGNITSGNVTASNIYANVEANVLLLTTSNISAPSNININSNGKIWTFGTDGNLTLPANAFAINYANGTQVSLGGGNVTWAQIDDKAGNSGPTIITLGQNAGFDGQGNAAIAIGKNAGAGGQGASSITIGEDAGGNITQGANSVAIGRSAGFDGQGIGAVAIGSGAGSNSQGNQSVAIGENAGVIQGSTAVAIGQNAGGGVALQGDDAVAIGHGAGANTQGTQSVAIGLYAGETSQGINAVAIGANAGIESQGNNSIILNATGANLNQTTANTFTVAPVRNDVSNIAEVMFYNATSKEVTYGNTINVAGNVTAGSFVGNGGNITYQQTNTFYVDPLRTQNYTPSGTVLQPFFTVSAAISAAVSAGYTDSNPVVVLLLSNITENITMQPGIFLTSFGTGTHGSPTITGTITVSSGSGSISSNHYSINNLRLVAPSNGTCIDFTGSAAQRLFIRDVWLDTNGSGTCIFMDNANTTSVLHLNTGHLAHSGTGDIYCIDLTTGNAYLTDIETSGTMQVAAVRAGTVMTIDSSEIDANNDAAIEVYGGSLTVTNSIITNTKTNSNGVALNTTGSVCTLLNVLFSIPTGTGKAVFGTTTSLLYYLNVAFAPGSNTGKTASPALIATVLGTTWS